MSEYNEELINKFFDSECSPQEKKLVEKKLNEDSGFRVQFEEMEKIHNRLFFIEEYEAPKGIEAKIFYDIENKKHYVERSKLIFIGGIFLLVGFLIAVIGVVISSVSATGTETSTANEVVQFSGEYFSLFKSTLSEINSSEILKIFGVVTLFLFSISLFFLYEKIKQFKHI